MENETDPEVIRKQMEAQRTALTEKLETLEEKVTGMTASVTEAVTDTVQSVTQTVQGVTQAVQDTVEGVRGGVKETVQSVKEAFDLRLQFDRHPLAMTGGAVGLGFLVGILLPASRREETPAHANGTNGATGWPGPSMGGVTPSRTAAAQEAAPSDSSSGLSSLLGEDMWNGLMEKAEQLKEMAFGTALGLLGDLLARNVPPEWTSTLQSLLPPEIAQRLGESQQANGQGHQAHSPREQGATPTL